MQTSIRLFNDTANLSHTRGAVLVDVCRLCALAYKSVRQKNIEIRALAELAEKNGLQHFRGVSKRKTLGTRSRHYWYSLEKLSLVYKHESEYQLSPDGILVAQLTLDEHLLEGNEVSYLASVSENLRVEVSRIALESKYLRRRWFSNFVEAEDFATANLLSQNHEVMIERIYPEFRIEDLSLYFNVSARVIDSGYRLYPFSNWSFINLGLASRDHSIDDGVKALVLSDTARKELHEGLRRWTTYELEITMETPLTIPRDAVELVEKRRNIWIVTNHIDESNAVRLEDFANWVENTIRTHGNGKRVRTPDLIVQICSTHRIGLSNAKNLLLALHRKYADKFYFEAASEGVILQDYGEFYSAPEPWDYFLKIDGIWRPSLMLMTGGSNERE